VGVRVVDIMVLVVVQVDYSKHPVLQLLQAPH